MKHAPTIAETGNYQPVPRVMTRILIADDHQVVRSGLRSILEAQPGWEVVAEVADGKEAILKTIETSPAVWHLVRVTPYRREGASDCGLVVTILDVSALQRAEGPSGKLKLSGE